MNFPTHISSSSANDQEKIRTRGPSTSSIETNYHDSPESMFSSPWNRQPSTIFTAPFSDESPITPCLRPVSFQAPAQQPLPSQVPAQQQISLEVPAQQQVLAQQQVPAQRISHSSSLTWLSERTREYDRYLVTHGSLKRKYRNAANVPWTFNEWISHRQAMIEADLKSHERRIAFEKKRIEGAPATHAITPAFGGKVFNDGRSGVLALESIWTPVPAAALAERYGGTVWPTKEESVFEGDDRMKTNFGRCLPIVRDWTPEVRAVNFKLIPALPTHDFDQVSKPPTMEDVYAPIDEIDEEMVPTLLNKDVLDALDDDV